MKLTTRILGWIPLGAVLLIVALVYGAWATAFVQLGRRPLPSMDDPKYIGGISTLISNASTILILVLLVCWILAMCANAVIAVHPRVTDKRWWLVRFAYGLIAMLLLLLSVRHSPGEALTWFID
ncbi:hypothetical protein DB347_22740 [Opitutaceae bacterium EW11]|nr:hypothetical protein DB347_25420 [Opitutaceae bacterium EW11]PTY01720.1 hypothetical protein DB347_25375 [Opitutaceae bacterium EW11]PTY03006.1 hypothetical protein DB347_22690 [Opitutaceae bacterium EW11]PTY03016.1 hypothetical protein DB347_22740 [Opitutaceae bacterium EW11]